MKLDDASNHSHTHIPTHPEPTQTPNSPSIPRKRAHIAGTPRSRRTQMRWEWRTFHAPWRWMSCSRARLGWVQDASASARGKWLRGGSYARQGTRTWMHGERHNGMLQGDGRGKEHESESERGWIRDEDGDVERKGTRKQKGMGKETTTGPARSCLRSLLITTRWYVSPVQFHAHIRSSIYRLFV